MQAILNLLTLSGYVLACYAVWYGVEFMMNKRDLKEANGENNDTTS